MKFRKSFALFLVMILTLALVACGGGNEGGEDKTQVDPLVPTAISLKVKTAKVQINTELKLTYTITPATAQGDAVTVSVNNDLGSVVVNGTNSVILTAGSKTGNIKVTVTTTNGIQASKTIKIQEEAVESYPDLSGYNIKLAQAEHAMGEYDVHLTKETEDKYGYYGAADREAKLQAWDEIEENYNCVFTVNPYPSDAPWGPARWQYILAQAQNESPEFDFYICPEAQIPGSVAGNAICDMTDWYVKYGQNSMNEMNITANTYKQRLYGINTGDMGLENILGYNVGLWEKIHVQDPTIEEPAQLFLDGKWDFNVFKEYCIKVQTALNTLYTSEKYYCLSGYGSYYWLGLVNASGVKILDTTQLKVSITGAVETAAAQTLQEIFAAGAMDPSFQVDQNVATWNAGHSLFNSGDYWFYNTSNRWNSTLWGTEEETRYGYVPFPHMAGIDPECTYVGTTAGPAALMPTGREWAYKGFGEDCTTENIYRVYMDYLNTSRKYYTSSEDYDRVTAITNAANSKFGSEASVKAYLKIMLGTQQEDGTYVGGIDEYGFYDPFVSNSNPVVGNVGGAGTFAGGINDFIKGSGASQWVDAVGEFQAVIERTLVDVFG